MMIRLIGRFDTIPDEWTNVKYLMDLMGVTSIQELPAEVKARAAKNPQKGISNTWLVLKNNTPKFIRSVSEERNTIDRPYEVTDEMYLILKDSWFTSVKDLFVYSDGELYSAQLVRNYLHQIMRSEPDIASLVIVDKDHPDKMSPNNMYTRAWAFYFMLNYRKDLGKVIKDKDKIKQIVTFENLL